MVLVEARAGEPKGAALHSHLPRRPERPERRKRPAGKAIRSGWWPSPPSAPGFS